MANTKFACELCNVITYDKKAYDSHLLGAKHQAHLHTKSKVEKTKKCAVFVTGFGKVTTEEELVDLFLNFGQIDEHYLDRNRNFLIVHFKNEESAQKALNTKLHYQGQFISVRPRKVKENVSENRPVPNANTVASTNITTILSNCRNFDAQVIKLVEILQFPEYEMQRKYSLLCQDLQMCLSTRFADCIIWPFGSTVSGLNFRDSDVDVYVEISPAVAIAATPQLNPTECVKQARNVLKKSSVFSNLVAIPHAKTPIVKCVHAPTNVRCDFNFKNMLGVCNSRLIRYMLSLDSRLKFFMIIIKYWAQIHGLSGSGRMTNYCLIMLGIFYMQYINVPILPPVWILQVPEFRNMQAGWNGGFCPNPALKPPTPNVKSLYQLLHGFFQFYAKFDYGLYVICPLTGRFYSKVDFVRPEQLPDIFSHYKTMLETSKPLKTDTAICVQDPIELTHNLAGNISIKILDEFKFICEQTVNYFDNIGSSTLLLNKIFEPIFVKCTMPTDNSCEFKIPVGKTLACVEKSVDPNVSEKSTVLRRMWFEKVHLFFLAVLTKILLLNVNVKKVEPQSKLKKLEGQTDIHDESVQESFYFHCTGYKNVWEGRKRAHRLMIASSESKPLNFFDQEIAITDYMSHVLFKEATKTEVIVDFDLMLHCRTDPTEADFFLQNIKSKKSSFKQMASFLVSKFSVWFEKHMTLENNEMSDDNKNENAIISTENISDHNVKDSNCDEKLTEV